eukprot:COSAG01_NODE_1_length_100484_cov_170.446142_90_plen_199_part_00
MSDSRISSLTKSQLSFFSDISQHDSIENSLYLIVKYQHNKMRQGTACTKTRAEVRCTGAKPYNQKGSGRARRGTNRTPLRRGGGVIFGPKPRSYDTSLNKKVLSHSFINLLGLLKDKIKIVSATDKMVKTKDFINLLGIKNNDSSKVVLLVDHTDEIIMKVASNLNIYIYLYQSLDFSKLLIADYIYLTENVSKKVFQ